MSMSSRLTWSTQCVQASQGYRVRKNKIKYRTRPAKLWMKTVTKQQRVQEKKISAGVSVPFPHFASHLCLVMRSSYPKALILVQAARLV